MESRLRNTRGAWVRAWPDSASASGGRTSNSAAAAVREQAGGAQGKAQHSAGTRAPAGGDRDEHHTRGPDQVPDVVADIESDAEADLGHTVSLEDLCGPDSRFYDWKHDSRVHYVQRGASGPPLLLVHGFGVGLYQFQDNLADLSRDHRVWALDLLGQGASWPRRAVQRDAQLQYSLDTWAEQLAHFVREIMRVEGGVYVAGNSLGGLLAVCLAHRHPELVRGLVLLNAAPFWTFAPRPGTTAARLWPYDGTVPAPKLLAGIVRRFWFSNLSSPDTIREVLGLVYADKQAVDPGMVKRIAAAAAHPQALDAFISMTFSPRSALAFSDMAASVDVPICLIYGREDPWVVPVWGQRLKRLLPTAEYYELSPAGHCPHHEVPIAVDSMIRQWTAVKEEGSQRQAMPVGECREVIEADGRVVTITHTAGLPRNVFEKVDFWLWNLQKRLGWV